MNVLFYTSLIALRLFADMEKFHVEEEEEHHVFPVFFPSMITSVFILVVSSDECVYLCVSKKKSPDIVSVTSRQIYHEGRSAADPALGLWVGL